VLDLARRVGWPVLADLRSGCRVRVGGDGPAVVAAADAVLRSPEARTALRPEAVLFLGAPPVSKVWAAVATEAARGSDGAPPADVATVDPHLAWCDPDRIVGDLVAADPAAWVDAAVEQLATAGHRPVDHGWAARWAAADAAAQAAIDGVLAGADPLTEPGVARLLPGAVPEGTKLLVSSSMPVRDVEWYAPALERPPAVFANRGANGIDGVCSTALGLAAAGGGPVVALVGDLAFLHDVSALVCPAPYAGAPEVASCTLVVLDNGGGAIFSFLPHATAVDHGRFEALFGTPQAASVADVARGFGLPVAEASTEDELRAALGGAGDAAARIRVVRVVVPDRAANAALHERLHVAVADAVRESLA
jgi:2-succinyl-5-enolpyruvyl-6-hydroxy-3-cyclohexene-1-carboxylate synthase